MKIHILVFMAMTPCSLVCMDNNITFVESSKCNLNMQ